MLLVRLQRVVHLEGRRWSLLMAARLDEHARQIEPVIRRVRREMRRGACGRDRFLEPVERIEEISFVSLKARIAPVFLRKLFGDFQSAGKIAGLLQKT